jgi:tetratricopeptide (TPR) repeat protein
VAVWYLRRTRYLVMGWCLFVTTLIPVIGLVQVGSQSMADRYAYVPYIGLFIMVAWGIGDAVPTKVLPSVAAVAGPLLLLALAITTTRYLQFWQNGSTLFTRASIVAEHPSCLIEEGMADAALDAGRYDEAYRHAAEACTLSPTFAVCHFNMAQILLKRNQLRDALQQYELAATYASEKDTALASLIYSGAISIDLADYEEAEYVLASALKIDPMNSQALRLRQMVIDRKR